MQEKKRGTQKKKKATNAALLLPGGWEPFLGLCKKSLGGFCGSLMILLLTVRGFLKANKQESGCCCCCSATAAPGSQGGCLHGGMRREVITSLAEGLYPSLRDCEREGGRATTKKTDGLGCFVAVLRREEIKTSTSDSTSDYLGGD